jgi:hypothetical protein
MGRVTATDVPGGQGGGLGAWLVDPHGDITGEEHADPGHRAEEGPGRHDPVAVLGGLHLQPFGPHEHVHRPFDPFDPFDPCGFVAAKRLSRPPDRHGAAEHVHRPAASQLAGNPVHDADELGDERGGGVGVKLIRGWRSARACPAA